MDRRSLLKGALGTLSATVGAFALRSGVDARESAPAGVEGQQVMPGTLTPVTANPVITLSGPVGSDAGFTITNTSFVTGPDPDSYVLTEIAPDGRVAVIPRGAQSPWPDQMVHGMGVPRAEFPEFDPAHGIVMLDRSVIFDAWDVPSIRAAYAYTVAHRTPDRPLDGNHLAVHFMPRTMIDVAAYLDGVKVPGVTESYSDPSGWLVQMIGATDERGRYQSTLFGNSLRSRIVTGNVELRIGDVIVWPGDHTAPLLR